MLRKRSVFTTSIGIILLAMVGGVRADFALRDGDTVVFLGDSITAARTYGKIVENYTLLRYPSRKIRFINAGQGGDTATGALKRLDRDVFDRGATVVIVVFGINDIGWGTKADDAHKRAYLDSIRTIVGRSQARKVRAYIGSAPVTAEDPDTAAKGVLQAMCDEGLEVARAAGEHAIDIQRPMRKIQRKVVEAARTTKEEKDRPSLHVSDGVHLNDLGQLAMALAILKGLDAPTDVSSATIDVRSMTVNAADGCRISGLKEDAETIEFDRLDDGLPVNFGVFGALQFRFVPIPEELNRYLLKVEHLSEGRYEVVADGRAVGTYLADQLARGINISSATADGWQPGGPWDAQAGALIRLTDARSDVARSLDQISHDLPNHPELAEIRSEAVEANARIEALQRTLVRPRPFHFVIKRAHPKKD